MDKVSPIKLFDENKSLAGLNLRHLLFQHGRADYVRRAVDRVFALWAEGKVKPLVDSTWALEDVSNFEQKAPGTSRGSSCNSQTGLDLRHLLPKHGRADYVRRVVGTWAVET